MAMDVMQNQRQVCIAHASSSLFTPIHHYRVYFDPMLLINRTCRCFQRTARCSIQSCRRSRALVESFTTSPVTLPRSVSFHSLVSSSNNFWHNLFCVLLVYNVLLLSLKQLVCICFLPNYLNATFIQWIISLINTFPMVCPLHYWGNSFQFISV